MLKETGIPASEWKWGNSWVVAGSIPRIAFIKSYKKSENAAAVHLIKGLNSIILGAWNLWNIHNQCVIDAATNLAKASLLASGELLYWSLAGARDISNLLAQGLNES
jgi:hypothetical protein